MDTHGEPRGHQAPDDPLRPVELHPPGERVSETAASIAGVAAGATLGLLGGPLGAIVGAIAGAVGGWWAGHTIAEAAAEVTPEDDAHFRAHYATSPRRRPDRAYDDIRPAYLAGHLAARNPAYSGRDFDAVEDDFRRAWTLELAEQHGEWTSVRDFARAGYDRGRASRAGLPSTEREVALEGDHSAEAANRAHDVLHDDPDRPGDRVRRALEQEGGRGNSDVRF